MIKDKFSEWDSIVTISPITIVVLVLVLFTLAELRFRYAMENWRQGEKVIAALDLLIVLLFVVACIFYLSVLIW